jgi:hypothetical protein
LYTVPGKGIFVASQEMGEIRTIAKNQLEEAMQDAKMQAFQNPAHRKSLIRFGGMKND